MAKWVHNYMVGEDAGTVAQLEAMAASVACADSKIAVMPDGHLGKGCVVGSAISFTDKVVPNFVGVDVCCTVSMWPITVPVNFEEIDQVVHRVVPHGYGVRSSEHIFSAAFPYENLYCWEHLDNHERLRLSMGSLGSGNHFCSMNYDEAEDKYYLGIHCGSRNLGLQMAVYYQGLAVEHCAGLGIPDDECYLEGELLDMYLHDCDIIKNWVRLNHNILAESVLHAIGQGIVEPFTICHHNYVDTEDRIIRKGAIRAHEGDLCIIPLNMRDGTLIVRAKGNADWNYSLPHGAGRVLSRGAAKRQLTMEDFIEDMKDVYTTCVMPETIDESPRAYKPADAIMEAIQGNGEIVCHLKEVYNFKAH